MTRGLVRYQQAGDFHLLTFSCYHRLPYLAAAGARDLFESALERVRRRYNFVVAGYVVMPEHVHLLVSEPRDGVLARAVQALKLSVSVRRHERPFWRVATVPVTIPNEDEGGPGLLLLETGDIDTMGAGPRMPPRSQSNHHRGCPMRRFLPHAWEKPQKPSASTS